jgi:branched-chain amino acid transport system permease protein
MEFLPQIVVNVLHTTSLYTLLGISFGLVYIANKYFDLTVAAYVTVGAYSTYYLSTLGLPALVCIPLALLLTALFAYLLERYYYARLRRNKASSFVFMIASLGVLTVAQAIIAILFTSNIQTLFSSGSVYRFVGVGVTPVQLGSIIVAVAFAAAVFLVVKYTTYGAQLRAIADSEELSTSQGVNVKRVRGFAIVFAALSAATAGILIGMDTTIEPLMGMALLFKGVIAAFVVGLTNVIFVPLGALILASLETGAIWFISGEWKDAIAFGLLLLMLLLRPKGVLNI